MSRAADIADRVGLGAGRWLVDELGLIVHYSGWCERVASFDPAPAASERSR